jgi:arylsulfatase A-like enzyme
MKILLLILDALRFDHVNNELTPNLMKLAQKGVFFTNAFSCNSSTRASLPCILCSNTKYEPENNIASILNEHNFHTAIIHSNPILHTFYPGFKETIDIKSNKIRLNKKWKKKIRESLPAPLISSLKDIRANIMTDDSYLPYARARETLDFTYKWMNSYDNFFLWAHLMDPHIPYYPEKTSTDLSRKEMRILNDRIIESVHGNYNLMEKEITAAKTLYKEEIIEMDDALGSFINKLDENALLIITSDHGEEFNEYGQFSHHENKIVPELVHVPLIFCGPNIIKGKILDDYVSSLSISPSILELLEINPNIGLGKSIMYLMK